MYFLWYLLIGLVAGWLANLLVKGHGSGLVVNLIVGSLLFLQIWVNLDKIISLIPGSNSGGRYV